MRRDYNEEIVILVPLKQGLFKKKPIKIMVYEDFIEDEAVKKEYMIIGYSCMYDIINNGFNYIFQPEIKDIPSDLQGIVAGYSRDRVLREVSFKTEKGRYYIYKSISKENMDVYINQLVNKLYENYLLLIREKIEDNALSCIRTEYFYDGQAVRINLAIFINNETDNFQIVSDNSLINEEVKAYVMSSEYDNECSGYALLKKIAYNLCSTIKERIFDAEITLSNYFSVEEIEEYD
ncbi:MAG: hypothetical protein ACRDA5_13445 [Clostridium sp.]